MSKKLFPLISIIIPTYKRARFLMRAIDSALNQTYSKIEVVVVDDNDPNTDFRIQTEQLMDRYKENPNVKYIQHSQNLNGAAARNTGIKHSTGDYICFLDDDDWYLPEKTKYQLNYLNEHPEYDAVYCGYKRARRSMQPYKEGNLTFELLSGTDIIYTNTIMMKRSCAVACGGWDERFRRNQEAVFLLRYFSCGGKIGAIPNILVEFDISDATNRSNPIRFEEDFRHFLGLHEKEISDCTSRYPDAKELIYSYRFRGVLVNYIKYRDFKSALRLYKEMSHQLPGRFNHDCLIYITRKLLRQPLFKEFETR